MDTIIDAVAHMTFGDVLLLEAQEYDSRTGSTTYPVEINDHTFEAIRLATAIGIVVVEAGANGGYNLDTYTHISTGKQILNRASPDFRDSGAIMVGAASSNTPHSRLGFSNYGSRIDLYAWGENVDTTDTNPTGTDNTAYTPVFNGTSSASPIVTGVAIVVQGIAQANFGFRFTPLELRRILTINGTASNNPAIDLIGVMPDLRAIIDGHFVNLAPDVYLRDYVGDNGDPTSGAISASPDIIVLQSPVTNPQGAFGQGSGTEMDSSLSQDVVAGKDHAIYVRLSNRGGSIATDVSVDVYYATGATLQTPNLWVFVGNVVVPSVPTGRVLVASDEILWPAAAVPGPGHYCFIAVAGSPADPSPIRPDDLRTWDNYLKFIENNNNVAWRNFNVIKAPPSGNIKDPHQFPFKIPGAFDSARVFSIEALGSLPRGSSVELHIPLTLARQLRVKVQESQMRDKLAILPLPPFARYVIGSGELPPGSLASCSLLILVPEETYKQPGTFEFAIRQLYGGREVGRLTWHFGQPSQFKGLRVHGLL
jgi:serine protease